MKEPLLCDGCGCIVEIPVVLLYPKTKRYFEWAKYFCAECWKQTNPPKGKLGIKVNGKDV